MKTFDEAFEELKKTFDDLLEAGHFRIVNAIEEPEYLAFRRFRVEILIGESNFLIFCNKFHYCTASSKSLVNFYPEPTHTPVKMFEKILKYVDGDSDEMVVIMKKNEEA